MLTRPLSQMSFHLLEIVNLQALEHTICRFVRKRYLTILQTSSALDHMDMQNIRYHDITI